VRCGAGAGGGCGYDVGVIWTGMFSLWRRRGGRWVPFIFFERRVLGLGGLLGVCFSMRVVTVAFLGGMLVRFRRRCGTYPTWLIPARLGVIDNCVSTSCRIILGVRLIGMA
jgi:hypothetical protein